VADCSEESVQLISVGTHRLQVRIRGEGTPTVVIDTGLGDALAELRQLQDDLAQATRVITYNRAGYGQSEPGPFPRSSEQEVAELRALLEAAAVTGPAVLVGHSLGAQNVQVYASQYPQDVAAMVLLDPPPLSFVLGQEFKEFGTLAETMTAQWQAAADATATSQDPEERRTSVFLRTIASEHRQTFGESAQVVASIPSFGDLPLVVMASGKPNPVLGDAAEDFQRYWIEQSRRLVDKSSRGVFILVKSSSHHLYRDAPHLVAHNILAVVLDCRARDSEAQASSTRIQ